MDRRLTPEEWVIALERCGVKLTTAAYWADLFAEYVQDDLFTAGELDVANFVGQILHESSMLEDLEENLNYSAQRLCQVWPSRFPTLESAQPFARNPVALANKVYGGRMGNDETGDGWKYRGRGLIQLTGKDNYRMVEDALGLPLLDQPDLVATRKVALLVAIAWWEKRIPDSALTSVKRVTRLVNGGQHGLAARAALTQIVKDVT